MVVSEEIINIINDIFGILILLTEILEYVLLILVKFIDTINVNRRYKFI